VQEIASELLHSIENLEHEVQVVEFEHLLQLAGQKSHLFDPLQ